MDSKVYVVTGGTSFLGSALIRVLLDKGNTVYAVCRPGSERMYRLPKDERLKVLELDLDSISQLGDYIQEQCYGFFHFGWNTVDKDDMKLQCENIRYTLDAAEAAASLGCKVFLGAGSQAEYGLANVKLTEETETRPVTGYGMAKLCAGQMSRKLCQSLGIKHIWPRILSVYGPLDFEGNLINYMVNSMVSGKAPELSEGLQIWDYLYIDDCAKALYLLSEKGQDGEIYNIGSGEERTLRDYAEAVHRVISEKLKGRQVPEIRFGKKPYSPVTPMFLSGDISKLQDATGFAQETKFEDGIEKILEYTLKKPPL